MVTRTLRAAWYPHWAAVQHYAHGLAVHGIQPGYFPNGPPGHGAAGLYIETPPEALLAALVCAVLLIPASMLLAVTARAHATLARGLLRAPMTRSLRLGRRWNVRVRFSPLLSHNDM